MPSTPPKKRSIFFDAFKVLSKTTLGFLFLALFSQWQLFIPMQTIPYTLQSLALCMIAYFLSPKEAIFSVVLYLIGCSFGFPILSGGLANSGWFTSFLSGYMLASPLVVWIMSRLFSVYGLLGFVSKIFIFFVGHAILLLGGCLRLSLAFPLSFAFHQGMLVFLGSGLVQSIFAAGFAQAYERVKVKYLEKQV